MENEDLLLNMAFDDTIEMNTTNKNKISKLEQKFQIKEKEKKKLFGIDDKGFFLDLFMPKDPNF